MSGRERAGRKEKGVRGNDEGNQKKKLFVHNKTKSNFSSTLKTICNFVGSLREEVDLEALFGLTLTEEMIFTRSHNKEPIFGHAWTKTSSSARCGRKLTLPPDRE